MYLQRFGGTHRFPNMCYTVWEPVCETQLVMRMKIKDDAIPVVQGETLIYQRSGQDERLLVGAPIWYSWLSTARSFAFRSTLGSFTARKEPASNKGSLKNNFLLLRDVSRLGKDSETWSNGVVPLTTYALLFDVELLHVVIGHFLPFLKSSV